MHRPAPFPAPLTLLGDSRGKAVLWILLVLLVAGGGFALWYFALRTQTAASTALAQRVIPPESDVVGGLDLGRLLTDPELRKMLAGNGVDFAQLDKALAEAGVSASDLGALAFGATMNGATPKDVVLALEAKTDARAMVGFLKLLAAQLPGPMASLIDADAIQALDGAATGHGVFVMGSGALLERALALGRGQAQPGASGAELALVQKALDGGANLWFAAPVPPDTFKGLSGSMAKQMIGGAPSHFGFSVGFGTSLDLRAAMHIPGADASTISGALKTARKLVGGQLPEAQRKLLDEIDLGGSGPVVTARLRLSESMLKSLIAQAL